jgi:hypothetical protein
MDAALLSCGELIRRKPNPTYCELIGLPATSVLLLSKNTPVVQKYDLCAKRRDGTLFSYPFTTHLGDARCSGSSLPPFPLVNHSSRPHSFSFEL